MIRFLVIALLAASPALAQSVAPVILRLQPLTTTNDSSTIAVTDTFQSIQVSTATRKGCVVQNNTGTAHDQWVFFGAIGSATKAASVLLTPGGSVSCATPNGVLTDQVSITGTSGDSFYAAVQ